MRRIGILLALLSLLFGYRVEAVLVTATVTVTNIPATSNSWTVNGDFRYWTNAQTASTILTNSTGLAPAATNLLSQIQSKNYANIIAAWYSPTQITLKGSAVAITGPFSNWASIALQTNGGAITYSLDVPATNVTGLDVRTNNANYITDYLNLYGRTPLATNSAALSNAITAGPVAQSMANKAISGGTLDGTRGTNLVGINGTVNQLTNGSYITPTITSPITANLTNTGLAISSPNTNYPGSEQFGTGATANTNGATALGQSSAASGYQSTAIGNSATVGTGGYQGTAVGTGSEVTAYRGAALGAFSAADGSNSVAVGTGAQASFDESGAFGQGVQTTTTNQYKIGQSIHWVQIDGRFTAQATNMTFKGTNQWHGSIQYPRAATGAIRTGLANTNNYLDAATNAELYVTGATTLHNFTGMKGGQDGQRVRVRDGCGTDVEIFNLDGSVTASDRFWTGTGSKITLTNKPVYFEIEYNSQSNWWEVVTYR